MKRIISILLAVVMIFVLLPASVMTIFAEESSIWDGSDAYRFASGTGTATDPYIIETGSHLAYLARIVNTEWSYTGQYIKLANDIVLNDTTDWETWDTTAPANSWTPAGNASKSFQGVLMGDGHTISGIYIDSGNNNQGLFGYIGDGGYVDNVKVVESYIKGNNHTGSIAGYINGGAVSNCCNSGEICGNGFVGGVAGFVYSGSISNCYNTGEITGNTQVGGVAGTIGPDIEYIFTFSTVRNCYNTGAVNGTEIVGGVAGSINQFGSAVNCYNTGEVAVTAITEKVGGVAGFIPVLAYGASLMDFYGAVMNCYYLSGTSTGGINSADIAGQAEALTDAQMKLQSNFVGWDFSYEWFMDERYQYADGTTMEYPQLQTFGDFSSIPSSAIWDGSFDTAWAGSGKESNPYLITSAAELAGLAKMVNSGTSYFEKFFELTSYIVLNDSDSLYWHHNAIVWTPIGRKPNRGFGGTFKGNGYTVSGIYINTPCDNLGLFGSAAIIDNIGVVDSYIEGKNNIGGLVGSASSVITNCFNTGVVKGNTNVGGIVGYFDGKSINDCLNEGTISGISNVGGISGYIINCATVYKRSINNCSNNGIVNGTIYIGGIIGFSQNSSVISCYNTQEINGCIYIGGITGYNTDGTNYGSVNKCYNVGKVKGYFSVGGVTGYNYYHVVVSYCYNAGTVMGSKRVGGIAGEAGANGSVTNCGNKGAVIGDSVVGGVAGQVRSAPLFSNCFNDGPVVGNVLVGGVTGYIISCNMSNCYNTGTVNGYERVGGVTGDIYTTVIVSNCYNAGAISGTVSVGGVAGSNNNGSTVEYCYYLSATAGGGVNGTDAIGQAEALTDVQMKLQSSFANWDFQTVWEFSELSEEYDYPTIISLRQGVVWDGGAIPWFASGSGTETDPCIIAAASQLAFLASSVNSGTSYENQYFKLTNDITLNNTFGWESWNTTAPANSWTPIGNRFNCFKGSFDGSGHTVSGIYINSTIDYQGLFGFTEYGVIKNLGVIESYIKGHDYVGGVVGKVNLYGTINNCCSTGTINGNSSVGGVAGQINSHSTVSDCYNSGGINGNSSVGGVAGNVSEGVVTNCYNVGAVSGVSAFGGITGTLYQPSTINNNYYLTGTAPGGINGTDVAGQAEVRTDAQMRLQSSYADWDFNMVWEFGRTNGGYYYPTLIVLRKPVTGVNFSDESITLNISETKQLAAIIVPDIAFNKNLLWASSDNDTVSVSSSGIVTAHKSGAAVITVTTENGGFTDTCTVFAVNPSDEMNYHYVIRNGMAITDRYYDYGHSCVTLPSFLGGHPLCEIDRQCFKNHTEVSKVYFPETITKMASDVFLGCTNLQYIYFSGNAPEIIPYGDGGSGDRLSASPFGAGVTVYYRKGTTGWDNATWNDRAVDVVPGDLSGDGIFNMIDAVAFVQRLAQGGAAQYTEEQFVSADIVRDGAINMIDIVKMVQALANPSIVLY